MDWKGRRDTVADAFQVIYPKLIASERVLLVDDVFTTGATVSSCARVLKEAGARDVFVFFINGAKEKAPAAASALIERLG